MGRRAERWDVLRCLTVKKIWNALLVYGSYYVHRWLKKGSHPAFPVSLSIEPTTACNLGCPECPSGLKAFHRPTGNLNLSNFQRWISPLTDRLIYLNFYFQGEPFIHPQLLQMVSWASQQGVYTSISTNGHFLSPQVCQRIMESGLKKLIVSIDGMTQDVYEQYRIHGSLNTVIQGVHALVEAKKVAGKGPEIVLQFLVVKPNEHQIPEAKRKAKEWGVDQITFKTAQLYEPHEEHPLLTRSEKWRRYKKKNDGTWGIKNELKDKCWRMWSSCVITWDGRVVPCCFDKDAHHAMGSLQVQTFPEVWNSESYQKFRTQLMQSRSTIDICKNCSEGTRVWG